MARPTRSGVDYFPLDATFFQDKNVRLIEAEFGEKGSMILLRTLCELYRTGGYCMKWDSDSALLMSADMAGRGGATIVSEVVEKCVERGIFDRGVYESYGVLTSRGIQRQYIRIVGCTRDRISIIEEYWLLDEDDPDDIPPAVLKKISFKSISPKKTPVSQRETPISQRETHVSTKENTTKQSKGNKSKAEESKAEQKSRVSAAVLEAFSRVKKPDSNDTRLLAELTDKHGEDIVIDAITTTEERGGRSVGYLEKVLESSAAPRSSPYHQSRGSSGFYEPTYSLDEVEALLDDDWLETT